MTSELRSVTPVDMEERATSDYAWDKLTSVAPVSEPDKMKTRGVRVNVFGERDAPLPPLDPISETIDVSCGVLTAKLIRERFICPGINRECIEYAGHFITPKTFYVMADKGSLKDWKNAIRIHGKKIRRYIDSGVLDFYNHSELCTGRCKSRISQSKLNLSDTIPNSPTPIRQSNGHHLYRIKSEDTSHSSHSSNESSSQQSHQSSKNLDSFGEERDMKPSLDQLRLLHMLNLQQLQPGTKKPSHSGSQLPAPLPMHVVKIQSVSPDRYSQGEAPEGKSDDVMFWRTIVQLGLIDEFFREIKAKLDVLKGNMVRNCIPLEDAKKASRIVTELGMREKLDVKLCAHKYEFDRQRDKLEREMELLKRKVTEYEQKSDVLKRKSDCYDQFMTKKLKLDEIPPDSEIDGGRKFTSLSPSMPGIANGNDSREQSPFPSQESSSLGLSSQEDSTDLSLTVNSSQDV
ncbi:glucocorticoid modulatory element-binding protein 1-like isoform X2 [Dreissena polymorpha]|uniref:SAND domain-containing protein n=1 Tax=Dreissena polymorpha TaxID=45954 RepID=A0A9D4DFH7_DREPO|nr:glucocorticoid modulatory element-binding protein 1-like isoform X2 [Dreissena polymorpha]KAH3748667.1 hypothetical protein DPMN_183115 [Dreissena polymorpha]